MRQPFAHRTALTLVRTNRLLPNFDRYNVKVDMLDLGNPFTFSLWYSSNSESAWASLVREVKLGGDIVFTIDDAPQLRGRIETLSVRVSRKAGACIVISGRDLAGPAISWDADPRTVLRGRTLDDCMQALFAPLGVQVITGTGADAEREVRSLRRAGAHGSTSAWRRRTNHVDLTRCKPGEKVMDTALGIVKRLGYMMWVSPTADGTLALVVDTPNYAQSAAFRFTRQVRDGRVTADSDIVESDYHAQIRTVPTVVTAYGRSPRGNVLPTRHRSQRMGIPDFLLYDSQGIARERTPTEEPGGVLFTPIDATPPSDATRMPFNNDELHRYPFVENPLPTQPLHLHSERARSAATGAQEAKRTLAKAMQDFRAVEITVRGHGREVNNERRLFAPNTMCHVRDALTSMDEDMLITGVEFMCSRASGQETKLTLGTKGAISLDPTNE
jgi:prophage tail gpP-like protein